MDQHLTQQQQEQQQQQQQQQEQQRRHTAAAERAGATMLVNLLEIAKGGGAGGHLLLSLALGALSKGEVCECLSHALKVLVQLQEDLPPEEGGTAAALPRAAEAAPAGIYEGYEEEEEEEEEEEGEMRTGPAVEKAVEEKEEEEEEEAEMRAGPALAVVAVEARAAVEEQREGRTGRAAPAAAAAEAKPAVSGSGFGQPLRQPPHHGLMEEDVPPGWPEAEARRQRALGMPALPWDCMEDAKPVKTYGR